MDPDARPGIPVRRMTLPEDSESSTTLTLEVMAALAHQGGRSLLLQQAARHIVGSGSVDSVGAIRAFLLRHVRFTADPLEVELITTPELQVQQIAARGYISGDCDDIAVLAAALGLAAGLTVRFVVLSFSDLGPWEHVYTEIRQGGAWLELDTSRALQDIPPDFVAPRAATFAL